MTRFDRVRPRTGTAEPTAAGVAPDAEGKRALFSSAEGEGPVAGNGVAIDCSRCGQHTLLRPTSALRAMFPAVHLSVAIKHGDGEANIGLVRRHFGSWLRCPACGRGSWVRVTFRL